jgi:hypothetical protein
MLAGQADQVVVVMAGKLQQPEEPGRQIMAGVVAAAVTMVTTITVVVVDQV